MKIPTLLYPYGAHTFPVGGKPKPDLLGIIFLKVVVFFYSTEKAFEMHHVLLFLQNNPKL